MTRAGHAGVLLACGLLWGSTQTLSKIAVSTGHGPFGIIFWQFVIGTLLLGLLLALRGRGVPLTPATLRFALVIAVIGTLIPNAAAYAAIAHLPAGIMSILISMVPILSYPMALALGTDRWSAARAAGLLCGIAGVVLIALPGATLPSAEALRWLPVALIGPLFYAIEGNWVALRGTSGMDGMQAMFLASAVGAVLALPVAVVSGQFIDPFAPWGRPEAALAASSAVHTVAYASYIWLNSRAGAVFASQTSYIVTGTGVLWAMAVLGERLPPLALVALLLMLAGLALVRPRPRAQERPAGAV